MSELKAIGESIGSDWGTREHYEAAKRAILTNYDPQTEYKAGDLIYCRHCGGKKTLDMPKKNIYLKCACSCIENRAKHEKYEREQRERAAVYLNRNAKKSTQSQNGNGLWKTWFESGNTLRKPR